MGSPFLSKMIPDTVLFSPSVWGCVFFEMTIILSSIDQVSPLSKILDITSFKDVLLNDTVTRLLTLTSSVL